MVGQETVLCGHNGYHSVFAEKAALPFSTTRVEPEDILLGEVSQTQKDKNCVIHVGGNKKVELYRSKE